MVPDGELRTGPRVEADPAAGGQEGGAAGSEADWRFSWNRGEEQTRDDERVRYASGHRRALEETPFRVVKGAGGDAL